MIKAIIFDWGGVLITNPEGKLSEYCAKKLGVRLELFMEALNKHLPEFQRGSPEVAFWNDMCAEFGVNPPLPGLWKEAFLSQYEEQSDVWEILRELRASGYTIGLISNAEEPTMEAFLDTHNDLFDGITFSCAEMTRKPDKIIYKIGVDRAGVQAKHAVFIDDKEEFVEGAKKAGLNAIHFVSAEQLKRDLVELGVNI